MNVENYPTTYEENLLKSLLIYHYLTVDQFMLAANQPSVRNTYNRLKRLTDNGYLLKIHRRTTEQNLPLKAAYRLTGKAVNYLQESGNVTLYPRQPSPYFLDHTLEINDVLLQLLLLSRNYPDRYKILAVEHDRELRGRTPPLLAIPDAYVDLALLKEKQSLPLFFEIDRGEESQKQWSEKIERYSRFLPTQMQPAFHTDVITITTLAPTRKRVMELKGWTEEALKRLKVRELGELFYFGVNTTGMIPEELFLTQRYEVAYKREGMLLFDLSADRQDL